MFRKRLTPYRRRPGDTGPNFLFSLPPFVEWVDVPTVVMYPSGGDDTPTIQAAATRLGSIGGGVMRFSEGTYQSSRFDYPATQPIVSAYGKAH